MSEIPWWVWCLAGVGVVLYLVADYLRWCNGEEVRKMNLD